MNTLITNLIGHLYVSGSTIPTAPYWDTGSCILYLLQCVLGAWCFSKLQSSELGSDKKVIFNRYYLLWGVIWVFFATYRMSEPFIVGADTRNYVLYFENCWGDVPPILEYIHNDFVFSAINKIVRLVTDDYHIFFILLYGFMFYSCVLFLNTFCPQKISYAPFILVFYVWLRGYLSVRTNLGFAFLLLSMVFLVRKKPLFSIFLVICSVFCHKSFIAYSLYLPFLFLFSKETFISSRVAIILTLLSTLSVTFVRDFFPIISKFITPLQRYQFYIQLSARESFFDGFWKISFEQMLLAAAMLIMNAKLQSYVKNLSQENLSRVRFIWNICLFDIILIPITFVLHIWRGYEFLYLPRLIMWGILIYIFEQLLNPKLRKYADIAAYFAFIAWFIFRIYNTYEDSYLMPYILDLS